MLFYSKLLSDCALYATKIHKGYTYDILHFLLNLVPVRKVLPNMLKDFHLIRLGFCCWNNTLVVVHEMVHKSREPGKQKKVMKKKKETKPLGTHERSSIKLTDMLNYCSQNCLSCRWKSNFCGVLFDNCKICHFNLKYMQFSKQLQQPKKHHT